MHFQARQKDLCSLTNSRCYYCVCLCSEEAIIHAKEEDEGFFCTLVALSAHFIGLNVTHCKFTRQQKPFSPKFKEYILPTFLRAMYK